MDKSIPQDLFKRIVLALAEGLRMLSHLPEQHKERRELIQELYQFQDEEILYDEMGEIIIPGLGNLLSE